MIGLISLTVILLTHSAPAPAVTLDAALNEQVVMIPVVSGGESVDLETTIFKPPGEGPFPLVIMNHGKALGNPRAQGRDRFVVLSREFVRRGYAVVIPMRKGFSKSTGDYTDPGCNMTAHGQMQADDLQGTLEYLRGQTWVDKDRIVVAGQSYGGLTALAFGTRNFPGVRGLINFAGGLRMHGGDCRWEASLVKAFANFGGRTALPSLWFYGANDQHFSPELASRMYDAYNQAGGHAKLVAFGAFKKDAHGMSGSRDGVKIWWPETEKFLREVGMPTEPVIALSDEIKIPKTEFASIENIGAVPYLRDRGREQYKVFLSKPFPRAFAVSPTGAWSWAEDGDDPVEQVLAECQKNSSQPCKLYAVDNNVVWADNQPVTTAAAPVAPSAQALTGP
ncbi:dienelactone hydrolase family protein [Noviherbaspirillum galbum]|uniref:Prolyl oligopeptidase family serine peptidase n=1 Tax=Noviherbaspirillum galbum TaxID=2709383 RepID=A0A6B3SS52_9BURK|nr:CocE/NonD family hydrolase [Noviherbaspirillum galbum]NEX63770.1 prolyl oligopeptidase family serine peptidase [Noviherbaspirillum galbum]